MNTQERLQLDKMIKENNVEDLTDDIRNKRHSELIRDDVTKMIDLKKKYSRLSKSNPESFESMLISQTNFLFTNYTDIFNKVKNDEINLVTLWDLLNILKKIEDGDLDQHTGAYEVGKYLKKLYIDSALVKGERLDKKHSKKQEKKPNLVKKISWKEYKQSTNNN